MKNNSVIELTDVTMVLAFGSELPQFLLNEMKKEDSDVRFDDGSDKPSRTAYEVCYDVLTNQNYWDNKCGKKYFTINGTLYVYEFGEQYLCEDNDQWWQIGDIGGGMQVLLYQRYIDDDYVTVFDDRDFRLEKAVRSSIDSSCGAEYIGTMFCEVLRDHVNGDIYYVPIKIYHEWEHKNRCFLPLNAPAQLVAGTLVRGMTEHEEMLYNEERLMALTDFWGNIALETPNEQWIKRHLG